MKNLKLITAFILFSSFTGLLTAKESSRTLKGDRNEKGEIGSKKSSSWILKGGVDAGLSLSAISEKSTGFGYSPETHIRLDLQVFDYLAVMNQTGYIQSRMPMETGTIRADFVNTGLFLRGRITKFKSFVPYVFAGAYSNFLLSSEYEDNQSGLVFEFKDKMHPFHYGISGGIGVEYNIWKLTCFLETVYSIPLSNTVNSVNNSILQLDSTKNNTIQIFAGALLHFYTF